MKCFLHIGTEKTATTTIQHFLHLNRNTLRRAGFVYTKSMGEINNRKLPVIAYGLGRRDEFTIANQINTDKSLAKYQCTLVKSLQSELSVVRSNLIFSSEHIQSRLTSITEVKRLKEILNNLGFTEFVLIVYLRNPADIANSLYSTAVKSGSTNKLPHNPENPYYRHICNHKNTLQLFGGVFGDHVLIPKIFEESSFKNGSIIEDFADTIGLLWDQNFNIPKNLNESISVTGLELLRRVNERIPVFIDGGSNPLRQNIVSFFEKNFNENKYVMPLDLWKQYDEAFFESNEWVRSNFFPSRKSLFEKKDYPSVTEAHIACKELDQIANLIIDIWLKKSGGVKKPKMLF